MRSVEEIAWLAGLLEGEGCFVFGNTTHITLQMTDRDVVERAYRIMDGNGKVTTVDFPRLGTKPCYRFQICGPKAVAIMVDIYRYMGERRREKIVGCLEDWYSRPGRGQRRTHCYKGHLLSDGNIYLQPNGKQTNRICATCHKERQRGYNARNAEAIAFRRAARKAEASVTA